MRNLEADKLRLGTEIAQLALGEVDYVGDTITLDTRAADLFDLPANVSVPRKDLHDRIHPDDREGVECRVSDLLSERGDDVIDVTHRVVASNGTIRWLNARKTVVYEQQGGADVAVQGLVVIRDVTESKSAEQRIQNLMGEVAHRSKNLLMVVSAIARMTARHAKPNEFLARFTARLEALASNQAVLVDDKWSEIQLGRLVKRHIEPFVPSQPSRITVSGPSIKISERAAQAIGMALHELATNAVKYGALSNTTGKVDIHWTCGSASEGTFAMMWIETDGPRVVAPTHSGFGSTVIQQMASNTLMGTVDLDYNPEGLAWTITAPLSSVLA
ncbi:MAG: sensor histidine kinase [Litorimonas sp.]